LHNHALLLWHKLHHGKPGTRVTEGCKHPAKATEIGMAHMGAFAGTVAFKRKTAECIGGEHRHV
jgi:hypothetical protein